MVDTGDIFTSLCGEIFLPDESGPVLEELGATKLSALITGKETAGFQLEEFLGSDYTNYDRLPAYLVILLDEAVKKITPVTSTPIQYLKAIINWKKLLFFLGQYFDTLALDDTAVKYDHILLIDVLVTVLDSPWELTKITHLRLLLDDLADGREVIEKIRLPEYKVCQKSTLDDLRKAILKNNEVLKVCAKVLGVDQADYEANHLQQVMDFGNFYLLKKDTRLGQALESTCSRTLPNGMVLLYEVTLPLSRKRRSPQVSLARIAMAIFHEQVNYIRKVMRDQMKVFARAGTERTKMDAEYYLEKQLFSRFNFHQVLADTQANNRSLLNKLARVILSPERWNELHFTNTIKNMMSQLMGKDTAGYDVIAPSFKKFKGEQDWDETIMMLKREDETMARRGSLDAEI
eukprot:TRINITY_DN858_c0_g3_i1.p1 TRINITY_DN858_c0_g3~~TRINITY_DN858_c0_g3_i1.p1  ORF type:complete len:436 (-),score=38.24 TRINITY_DN858_c0_g3_i1:127-1338(-)